MLVPRVWWRSKQGVCDQNPLRKGWHKHSSGIFHNQRQTQLVPFQSGHSFAQPSSRNGTDMQQDDHFAEGTFHTTF